MLLSDFTKDWAKKKATEARLKTHEKAISRAKDDIERYINDGKNRCVIEIDNEEERNAVCSWLKDQGFGVYSASGNKKQKTITWH